MKTKLESSNNRGGFVVISMRQRFPLDLGRWKIWLNEENSFYSMKTYVAIFKDREHRKVAGFPSKKDTVIFDLGANEGFYTLKAREMAPKAKIIAVEPNPSAFRILKRNIAANGLKDVIALNMAVTSRNGKVGFEVVKGQTSIGGLKVYKKYRKRGELKRIVVGSVTLNRLCTLHKIDCIDLLKMDVEGSELDVLKGGKGILPNVRKVVLEYHGAQKTEKPAIRLMVKNNFRIAKTDRKKYYGDIYFVNKSDQSS